LIPQGEAKGLDTIGKRAQLKIGDKELPNAWMHAPPEQMHFSQIFFPLMQNSPWMHELCTFLPLVGNA
jgi:hypothetical protein